MRLPSLYHYLTPATSSLSLNVIRKISLSPLSSSCPPPTIHIRFFTHAARILYILYTFTHACTSVPRGSVGLYRQAALTSGRASETAIERWRQRRLAHRVGNSFVAPWCQSELERPRARSRSLYMHNTYIYIHCACRKSRECAESAVNIVAPRKRQRCCHIQSYAYMQTGDSWLK